MTRSSAAARDAGAAESRRQAAAIHELEGEIGQAGVLADFVDLHDVRVLKPGHGFGLGTKPRDLVPAREAANHLEGHAPLERAMPRRVNDPHSAPAQFAGDLVTG